MMQLKGKNSNYSVPLSQLQGISSLAIKVQRKSNSKHQVKRGKSANSP